MREIVDIVALGCVGSLVCGDAHISTNYQRDPQRILAILPQTQNMMSADIVNTILNSKHIPTWMRCVCGGGGGGTLITSYISRLGPFFGG